MGVASRVERAGWSRVERAVWSRVETGGVSRVETGGAGRVERALRSLFITSYFAELALRIIWQTDVRPLIFGYTSHKAMETQARPNS